MKSNRKITVLFITIVLSSVLISGCQLANKKYSTAKDADELCGVFVTVGEKKLPVKDITTNQIPVDNSNEINLDEKQFNIQNKVDGTVSDDGTANFKGLKGYYLGIVQELDDKGNGTNVYKTGNGFSNNIFSAKDLDNISESSCEGTLTVSSKLHDLVDIDPVYRREDGTYYVVLDMNAGFITNSSCGTVFSKTLASSLTNKVGKSKKGSKNSFTVHLVIADETTHILIKEMNQNDKLIKTTKYQQTDPETFVVNNKTKYVIVEEYKHGSDRGDYISRSICNPCKQGNCEEESTHSCSFANTNGVIDSKDIQFVYK